MTGDSFIDDHVLTTWREKYPVDFRTRRAASKSTRQVSVSRPEVVPRKGSAAELARREAQGERLKEEDVNSAVLCQKQARVEVTLIGSQSSSRQQPTHHTRPSHTSASRSHRLQASQSQARTRQSTSNHSRSTTGSRERHDDHTLGVTALPGYISGESIPPNARSSSDYIAEPAASHSKTSSSAIRSHGSIPHRSSQARYSTATRHSHTECQGSADESLVRSRRAGNDNRMSRSLAEEYRLRAGTGWISPHPLSVSLSQSSADRSSHVSIELPNREVLRLTYDEWKAARGGSMASDETYLHDVWDDVDGYHDHMHDQATTTTGVFVNEPYSTTIIELSVPASVRSIDRNDEHIRAVDDFESGPAVRSSNRPTRSRGTRSYSSGTPSRSTVDHQAGDIVHLTMPWDVSNQQWDAVADSR